jgi:hypothetical protein
VATGANRGKKMVEITVIIEGGIVNTDKADTLTVDNSQLLRQSFNMIFSKLLKKDVSIVVQLGAGYRNAASQFVKSEKSGVFLFVDLDDRKEHIPNWFTKLETENPDKPITILDSKKDKVFFMIQEMEAWFLKQPASIDKWGKTNNYLRLHPTKKIEDHSLISSKDIENIAKPSEKLYDLIKHFFENERNGKKIQYGKLKSAPGLLDQLDVSDLLKKDCELQRFCKVIKP